MKKIYLKQNSEFHDKILKAEKALEDLGISISYCSVNEGIQIIDMKNGRVFKTTDGSEEPCFNFPREVDTKFVLL